MTDRRCDCVVIGYHDWDFWEFIAALELSRQFSSACAGHMSTVSAAMADSRRRSTRSDWRGPIHRRFARSEPSPGSSVWSGAADASALSEIPKLIVRVDGGFT
jgi:hypothetical protein